MDDLSSLLISLTASPANISRPGSALLRIAEATGLSTTPQAFFRSTTMGTRPSSLMVERMGPVDFSSVAAPRLSYHIESTAMRRASADITQIVAVSIGNNQKGK